MPSTPFPHGAPTAAAAAPFLDPLAKPRAGLYIDLRYVETMFKSWSSALLTVNPDSRRVRPNYWYLADILGMGYDVPLVNFYDALTEENPREPAFYKKLRIHPRFRLNIRYSIAAPYYEQKEVDVALAIDMVQDAMRGDIQHSILVTGDRDFVPAVQAVRRMGIPVTVAGFYSCHTSKALRLAASRSINLDELPMAILTPPRKEADVVA